MAEEKSPREEFKDARKALGLSAQAMADALLVKDGRTIRRWESGQRDIPGPALVAVRYMLEDPVFIRKASDHAKQ